MTDKSAADTPKCEPCEGGIAPLSAAQVQSRRAALHPDWSLSDDGARLTRRLKFKGYAKAVYHANLAAWLADQAGHHPDVAFGWGYCEVTFTTHDICGLSENDFVCAARFDRLLAG